MKTSRNAQSVIFSILLFCSCCNNSTEDAFAHIYMKGVSIIEEYGYGCTSGYFEIDLEELGLFCDAADYMGSLTGIKYHLTYVDIPVYESNAAVQQDVDYLKSWYKKYGRKMTKDDADLIVKKSYENSKSTPPNIDSVIARWDELQERKLSNKAGAIDDGDGRSLPSPRRRKRSDEIDRNGCQVTFFSYLCTYIDCAVNH